MSVEIYKYIKALPNGNFLISSSSNNCFNCDGTRAFGTWEMSYFKDNFPELNMTDRRITWLFMAPYTGDRFYQANWKQDKELVVEYAKSINKDITYMHDIVMKAINNREDRLQLYADILNFKKFKNQFNKTCKSYKITITDICNGTNYIEKITNGRCNTRMWMTCNENKAKVFKGTLDKIEKLIEPFKNKGRTFNFIEQ